MKYLLIFFFILFSIGCVEKRTECTNFYIIPNTVDGELFYGLIDSDGGLVVQPVFDSILYLNNELFLYKNDVVKTINYQNQGNESLEMCSMNEEVDSSVLIVHEITGKNPMDIKKSTYHVNSIDSSSLYSNQFYTISPYVGKLAFVLSDNGWCYINKEGKDVWCQSDFKQEDIRKLENFHLRNDINIELNTNSTILIYNQFFRKKYTLSLQDIYYIDKR